MLCVESWLLYKQYLSHKSWAERNIASYRRTGIKRIMLKLQTVFFQIFNKIKKKTKLKLKWNAHMTNGQKKSFQNLGKNLQSRDLKASAFRLIFTLSLDRNKKYIVGYEISFCKWKTFWLFLFPVISC